VDELIRRVDSDGSQTIEFDEFVEIMTVKMSETAEADVGAAGAGAGAVGAGGAGAEVALLEGEAGEWLSSIANNPDLAANLEFVIELTGWVTYTGS